MYTKNDLKNQLKNMGLTGNETILIHSSMKSIGDVQDRAEGVLDVLIAQRSTKARISRET